MTGCDTCGREAVARLTRWMFDLSSERWSSKKDVYVCSVCDPSLQSGYLDVYMLDGVRHRMESIPMGLRT